jgi:hypothetical protein
MEKGTDLEFTQDVLNLLAIELPKLLQEVSGGFKVIIHISPDHNVARVEPPTKPIETRRRRK